MCSFDPASKFTLQLCLWDSFKDFANDDTMSIFEASAKRRVTLVAAATKEPAAPIWTARRLVNGATLLAFLVKRHVVSLAVRCPALAFVLVFVFPRPRACRRRNS